MASKDWKLPDAQHKITEEKGLDIENESIQRQWEKTIVSLIRLEDAFSDIDVYDDTEEGEIPYRQYLMRRWLFIHQDKWGRKISAYVRHENIQVRKNSCWYFCPRRNNEISDYTWMPGRF